MKRITIISLLISIIVIPSCSFDESLESPTNNKAMRLVLSSDKNYTPHIVEDALAGDYTPYLKVLKKADFQVGISSHRDGARSSREKLAFYSGESPFKPATRATSQELPKLISSIDGIELNRKNLEAHIPTRNTTDSSLDVFGKTVSFKMRTSATTRTRSSDAESSDDVTEVFEMYIPQRISILAPAATNPEDNNPLCYFGDFVVRWNVDEQNCNGVLILVEWFGGMAFGGDIEETHVSRIAIVPDSGEATLDPCIFDDIPDSALCHLIVIRGVIENVQGEEYSYNLIGETHHMISFTLIREVEYL